MHRRTLPQLVRSPTAPSLRCSATTWPRAFVTAADGHGGTLVTEAAQTADQLLATPHTG